MLKLVSKKQMGGLLSKSGRPGYNEWRASLPQNLQSDADYDLKGYYNKYGDRGAAANGHLTDEFKLPNHPTFSNESIYFNPQTMQKAGYWTPQDVYIPFNDTRPSFDEPNHKYIEFNNYNKLVKKQTGGVVNKLALDTHLADNKATVANVTPAINDQMNWTKNYVNSPMYKERLTRQANTEKQLAFPVQNSNIGKKLVGDSIFGNQPADNQGSTIAGNLIKHQNESLNSLSNDKRLVVGDFSDGFGVGGSYHHDDGKVYMPLGALSSKEGALVPAHEISHGLNGGNRPWSYGFGTRYIDGKILNGNAQARDPYVQDPTEVKARLDAMRYQMSRGGYYDAGTQKFDQSTLDKMKADPNITNDVNYKSLSGQLNPTNKDNSLIWLFNNIAQNKQPATGMQYAQQGTKLVMKRDKTNVVPMPLQPDHVDDNEVMRDITLADKTAPWETDALKKQLMKYGNPSLSYGGTFDMVPSTGARYSPFTNNIVISDRWKGNTPMTKGLVLSELAHAKQRQDNPFELFGKAPLENLVQRPFIDMYKTPGTFEYNAHSVIEPGIKKEYNDDIKNNYIPTRDEYDDDDPDSPFNKPSLKKPSKLELLKKNNQ